jgi:hypothetical protein
MKKAVMGICVGAALVAASAAQAQTVNVAPSACSNVVSQMAPPCPLRVPVSETIYSTTSKSGVNVQGWRFHAKKGQHYSIRLTYLGQPVPLGGTSLVAGLVKLPASGKTSRSIVYPGGALQVFVTCGFTKASCRGVPALLGQPLKGTFSQTGTYLIAVMSETGFDSVPYRLDIKLH